MNKISPIITNTFNAFSNNRLIRKTEGNNFQIAEHLIISPKKFTFFTFFHLMNRSITRIPWLFWFNIILQFVQIATSIFFPQNSLFWESSYPNLKTFFQVIVIIARYIPLTSSENVWHIMFVFYFLILLIHYLEMAVILYRLSHKRPSDIWIKIFFFHSYLVLPFLRISMTSIISFEVAKIVRNPSVSNFFLSFFGLIALILHVFMDALVTFIMGSSPSPNLVNPMSIWAPCTWKALLFEMFTIVYFILQEFIRTLSGKNLFIAILIISILIIPLFIYLYSTVYYISYYAYVYIADLLISCIMFQIFLMINCFHPSVIPSWVIIFLWVLLPIVNYIWIKISVDIRVKKVIHIIDSVQTPVSSLGDHASKSNFEDECIAYDGLHVTSANAAIFMTRAACLINHHSFSDLSLIKYFVDKFPEKIFYFLHLSFLIPSNSEYCESLIARMTSEKKCNILEQSILFQIKTSILESSSELTQTIVREINHQRLLGMKCQQLLQKFWSSTYKGDLSQMARQAFTLSNLINDLNYHWQQLLLRYPYSNSILKEYTHFLVSIGHRHKTAELIFANRPQLVDNAPLDSLEVERNMGNLLFIYLEDAVDRRPIQTVKQLYTGLIVCICISLTFIIFASVFAFSSVFSFQEGAKFMNSATFFQILITKSSHIFDEIRFTNASSSNMANDIENNMRLSLFQKTSLLVNYLEDCLTNMPDSIMSWCSKTKGDMSLTVNIYSDTNLADFIQVSRHIEYMCHTLPFVPINDQIVPDLTENLVNASFFIDAMIEKAYDKLSKKVSSFETWGFHLIVWFIFIIIMIPLTIYFVSLLKEELTYLFSIYLTIPRSTLGRYIENANNLQTDNGKVIYNYAINMNKNQDHSKSESTTKTVADSFKLLLNEGSVNISILPAYFVPKLIFVFCFICGIITLISSIIWAFYTSQGKDQSKFLWTTITLGKQASCINLLVHGVTTLGAEFSSNQMESVLEMATKAHSTLLFSSADSKLSKKALESSELSKFFNNSCSNSSSNCSTLSSTIDSFLNKIKDAIDLINSMTESQISSNKNNNNFPEILNLYDTFLSENFENIQNAMYNFSSSQTKTYKAKLLMILIIGLLILSFLAFVFFIPMFTKMAETINDAKLPLKFIHPLDISDLPRIMQYLQGECDWKRTKKKKENIEKEQNISFLNSLPTPFAYFDHDKTLHFANAAFYSLMNTTSESSIGLSFERIFAIVLNIRDHNFWNLYTSIRKGNEKEGEIRINLENLHKNIEVKFISLANGAFVIFINELSWEYQLSQNIQFETEISSLLLKNSISEPLAHALSSLDFNTNSNTNINIMDTLIGKKFDELPMAMFYLAIHENLPDDEYDDDLLAASMAFMQAAQDVNREFMSVARVVHRPPMWVYISGFDDHENGQTRSNKASLYMTELTKFALSLRDVFLTTSSQRYQLSVCLHYGSLSIYPLKLELPILEIMGDGYNKLKWLKKISPLGGIIASIEAQEYLRGQKGIDIRSCGIAKETFQSNTPQEVFSINREAEKV